MKYKANITIYGVKDNPQDPVLPGEVFEMNDIDAEDLVEAGAAEEYIEAAESELEDEAGPSAAQLEAARAKADLLDFIASAQTLDILYAGLPDVETDPEVLTAIDNKVAELSEPDH
jgi:hypothetical protein